MAKRNTSIQINGRHYDALTGDLLTTDSHPKATPITDVSGPVTARPQPVKQTATKAAHAPAAHAKVQHGTPSATLMRHAVKKPVAKTLKRQAKVQSAALTAHSQHSRVMHAVVTPKLSLNSIDHRRHARAQRIALSPQISHFAHEAIAAAPAAIEEAVAAIDKAIIIPTTISPQTYRPDVIPVRLKRSATSDVFEQALLRATSHEQPAPITPAAKRRRTKAVRSLRQRMISYGAGAVAVLAIVGFFGTQHNATPFKEATRTAGFSVTRPSYEPAGFDMASVQSASGYVGLNYKAPNGHTFAITQKPSSLDSQTLLTNLTNGGDQLYTTINKAGVTVYVYGRNQAAWVKNGVLYQILGNGALSVQEFGNIAASM